MARDYELGIIVNPDAGDDQARAIVERITQTIASNDGQVVRVNAWGRRRLAYPIEHHRDGLYFFFDLILNPDTTADVERTLRVNENILRHLLKVRDSRVVAQQRQRESEAEAQAAAQAAAAAVAAQAAVAAPAEVATEAPAETETPAEMPSEAEMAPEAEAAPVVTAEEEEEAPATDADEEAVDEEEEEISEEESAATEAEA